MGLTKKVLKRPVTTVLVVLCLIVFGLSSIFSSQLELIPEMEMPMLIVSAKSSSLRPIAMPRK
jgi:multidrug efflux pump subunit AcrB